MSNYYPPRPNFSTPNAAERNRLFGEFQYKDNGDGTIKILGGWSAQNIVRIEIPQLAGVEGAPKTGIVTFHKKGATQLQEFFEAVEKAGLKHLILSWAGSFYPRFVRGSRTSLSNHSWGTAFDINAPWNPLNRQPAPLNAKGSLLRLVPIANEFGFFWGGHYNSRLDGMHFELAVPNKFPKSFLICSTSEEPKKEPVIVQPKVSVVEPSGNLVVPSTKSSGESHSSVSASNPVPTVSGDAQPPKQSEKSVPENFVPQTLAVEAPAPTGFLAKIKASFASLGIGTATLVGAKEYLQVPLSSETVALLKIIVPVLLGLGAAGLFIWYVSEKIVGYKTLKLRAEINADPERHNVEVKPQ